MKSLAWLVALFVLAAGVIAIVMPDRVIGLTSIAATPLGLLVVAVVAIAIGVVLIMVAPATRAPKPLQAAGALLLGAGLLTPLFGVDRTRAVLEWEAAHGASLMRAIGAVVVALGGFLTFALGARKPA
jgi:hypothetical protein